MQSMSPLNSGLTIKPQSLTSTKDITIEGNHSFNPNQIVHEIPLLKLISRWMDATNESAWGNTKVWVSKYSFINPQHLQLLEICTKNQSCISTIWATIPRTEFRKRILCDSCVYCFFVEEYWSFWHMILLILHVLDWFRNLINWL